MRRYAKFGGAARRGSLAICEKQVGGQNLPPPHSSARVNFDMTAPPPPTKPDIMNYFLFSGQVR